MPRTNEEARQRLNELLEEKERGIVWLANKVGENRMWVSNRLRGRVDMKLEDYFRMLDVLEGNLATV